MTNLITKLNEGGYSCIVANGEERREFFQRGVADLYELLTTDKEFLRGSMIADKVVGKGAAAIMIEGGVARLYTHIISEGALQLLESSPMEVEYARRVPHIINRAGDGVCPVETLCSQVSNTAEIVLLIDKFITENKKNR